LFTGTDVDATIAESVEAEKRSKERLINMLEMKVSRLELEMQLVYSGR
jgi:hypothetical protein